jgi:tetratricopeptide (TPR) repeat protein
LSGLSVEARQQGRLEEALFLAEEAARLNPDLPNAYGNLAGVSGLLGHRERFLREQRRQTEAIERTEGRRAALRSLWVTQAILGDEGGALRSLEAVLAQPAPPGGFDVLLEGKAAVQAALHEATAARRTMAGLYQPHERGDQAMKDFAWWLLAPLEDWAGLEAELRAPSPPTDDPTFPTRTATRVQPRLAHAVARQGRHAEAAALIADTPLDCFWCVLNRGWVAALAGDADMADRWFAEAVRQGPSLPEAYSEWGEAKLLRGDTTGAIQLFGEARRRGPRWADPIKFEGDALARRGDHRAALRRYEDALERAPRWGAAHLAAGRSLQALGRGDQARARYEQAVQLDLSAADRAAVQRLLAGTRAAAPDVR